MAITLDGSAGITTPGVTDTGNLSVSGTSTLTGAVSQTGSSTAASFIPTGSSVPANGMYLSAANTLNFSTNTTNRMNIDSSGNLQVGGTTVANTAGYVNSRTNARAWVNFNGTSASPITPRASYNVSSVTKVGTGSYTVNLTTALADANGSVTFGGKPNIMTAYLASTSTITVASATYTGVAADYDTVCVSVFGN